MITYNRYKAWTYFLAGYYNIPGIILHVKPMGSYLLFSTIL